MKSVKTGRKIYCYKYTYVGNGSHIQMSLHPQLEFDNGVVSVKLERLEDEYKLV